jgi:lipoprotein-anchoring transpeptidase ErfK/SrfK
LVCFHETTLQLKRENDITIPLPISYEALPMSLRNRLEQSPLRKYNLAIRIGLSIVLLVILLLGTKWTIQAVSSQTLTDEKLPLMSTNTPTRAFTSTAPPPATPTRINNPTATRTPTPTAKNTSTPTATRTIVPSATPETTIKFLGDSTNLRIGPGTSYAGVRELISGELLTLLGRTSDNSWLYVRTTKGQDGWIRPTWIDLDGINLESYAIETPSAHTELKVLGDHVYLRTGPALHYVKVLELTFGDLLTLLGRVNDYSWLFVRTSDGQEGWIDMNWVDPNAINIYTDFNPIKTPPPTETSTPVVLTDVEGHWIDVDLSEQTLRAYDGTTLVNTFLVSTGVYQFPTQTGRFHIYVKYLASLMHGSDYYLPDVPFTMYYDGDFSIHGTYWHHNFGIPMSHGCVNMDISDAEWVFGFAPIGTLVNIHH